MSMRVLRILSVFVLMVVLLACSDAFAQQRGGRAGRGGGFGGGFGGFGGFGGGTSPVAFIQRDDVKQEIKLSSSQLSKIEALAEDGQGQGRGGRGGGGGFGNFQDMSDEERRAAFARVREQREEQLQDQRMKINEILNADQGKRFKELEFQYAVQQGRLDSALAIADIDVSDSDREKLQDAQRDAAETVREEMAKIQLRIQSAALAKVLDAEKIEQLTGRAFTFEQQQPNFGGGGGGRAGFGGRQGRGGAGGGDNARPGRPQRPSGDESGGANPRRDR